MVQVFYGQGNILDQGQVAGVLTALLTMKEARLQNSVLTLRLHSQSPIITLSRLKRKGYKLMVGYINKMQTSIW
jgi:hypothetical protein